MERHLVPEILGGPRHRHINLEPLPPGVDFHETIINRETGEIEGTRQGNNLPGDPITLDELQTQAKESSGIIFKSFNTLNGALKRYEDLIRTRWSRKTRAQRKSILETAWHTKIPTSHRPDLEISRRVQLEIEREGDFDNRDVYMWPHINLEDLLTPTTIPRFLNSRGRNLPRVFAAMDWDSTELGRETWSVRERSLDEDKNYHMNLEADNPEKYGAVEAISGEDDEEEVPNATRGLVILEIQNGVMEFLAKVCQSILHDKELDKESLEQVPEEPEPQPVSITKEGDWPSAIDLASESPYLVPQKADLGRVQSLIQARLREWKDYAWAMREDPSFFADTVGDWSEHSSEQVPSPDRKKHPDLISAIRKRNFWDRSVSSAINEVYENLVVWDIVNKHLTEISEYQKEQIEEGYVKPEDVPGYVEEVRLLKVLLDKRVIEKLQRELSFVLPSSPPMRSMFERSRGGLQLRSGLPKNDVLIWLGHELWEMKGVVPADILAMELNRIVQQDKTQKERITPVVARFFSDLGLAYELRSRLRMLCPQLFESKTLDAQAEQADISSLAANAGIRALYDLKMIASPSHSRDKFLRLGDLGEPTRLPYPVNKKRTKENVETMQATERQLDALWEKYDAHLQQHLKPNVNTLLQSAMPSRGELQRTPDWIEPEKPAQKAGKKPAPTEYVPPSAPEQQIDSITLPIRKEKPKTRGQAGGPTTTAPDEPVTETTEATSHPPLRFTLGKKPYHTFSTLFYKPSTSSQPGEVPWTDFVSAMSAISFLPEKLYGSVWRFTPKDGNVFGTETPINFHEPHPVAKLPFRTARLYGRRLTRNYGVDGGSFALGG